MRKFGGLKSFYREKDELNRDFYNLYLEKLNKISSDSYIDAFIKSRKV